MWIARALVGLERSHEGKAGFLEALRPKLGPRLGNCRQNTKGGMSKAAGTAGRDREQGGERERAEEAVGPKSGGQDWWAWVGLPVSPQGCSATP